ncbi:hypothetical protein CALVIDRAFT_541574 [Calocera viscosa TUFC12733]|uniref:Uncharacterized protein n=1 Tax=Calocera viscosa (strain TUFC12733) TaxID=1330018 RepID=A0A167HIQ1_CALVF|nr:hypothetical protein CALVIDRAFT_541574 [Calocera viscosa TUFC12733]
MPVRAVKAPVDSIWLFQSYIPQAKRDGLCANHLCACAGNQSSGANDRLAPDAAIHPSRSRTLSMAIVPLYHLLLQRVIGILTTVLSGSWAERLLDHGQMPAQPVRHLSAAVSGSGPQLQARRGIFQTHIWGCQQAVFQAQIQGSGYLVAWSG